MFQIEYNLNIHQLEWINKSWYIYTIDYLHIYKKNQINTHNINES